MITGRLEKRHLVSLVQASKLNTFAMDLKAGKSPKRPDSRPAGPVSEQDRLEADFVASLDEKQLVKYREKQA